MNVVIEALSVMHTLNSPCLLQGNKDSCKTAYFGAVSMSLLQERENYLEQTLNCRSGTYDPADSCVGLLVHVFP